MGLVDDTGFAPVDAGSLEDAWRMQAGTHRLFGRSG